ncbi:type II secretion system F family protein [Acetobacter sp. TBRC 12305]|uniref:Type II secretion system F family protein n=1 Tax=Acetobacter garciniae TaxID=2817435 RepID=A0A939HNN8_9PROT|nr:type II secretion system F family protein [Acetobacter garciniae]MBO1325124.1 type II secretion system F family protein [Acetobacter garciniae]MBX0344905.1 type II secretion system F family protein [Acetobacter garciniae]
MAEFRYTAVNAQGVLVRGMIEAPGRAEAATALRAQGHIPMRIAPPGPFAFVAGLGAGGAGLRRGGLRRAELASMTRELAVMLGAGQDIDRALRFVADSSRRARVRALLAQIRAAVRDGSTLHAAMARYPRSFPRLYTGMVRAAEGSGTLAATMEHLATLLERERALSATVQSAMIYPAVLTVAAMGSVYLLLTQVLPQFTPLFASNGVALPASTQFMVGLGDWLGRYGLALPVAALGLGLGARALLKRPAIRLWADTWVLRLPVAGSLLREILAARFARMLGTLLENGVPILSCLAITRTALANRAALAAIEDAIRSAKAGRGVAGALDRAGVFPPRMVHLLRLGEETARLGAMALQAANIHEEQTRLATQRLVALLVPAITIVMGLLVAGIVSSLLLAMLSLNDLAQ